MKKTASIYLNPIENFKSRWNQANPYEKWRLFYDFGVFVGDVIQLKVFSTKPTGILGYCPAVACVMHYTLLVYTVYYYINVDNFLGCLPSFCMFGVLASVSKP